MFAPWRLQITFGLHKFSALYGEATTERNAGEKCTHCKPFNAVHIMCSFKVNLALSFCAPLNIQESHHHANISTSFMPDE